MNQYLITAYDHSDADAQQRRLNIRPHHLDGAKELKSNGNYVMGGAMLNDEGKMMGSVMILQFKSSEELQAWEKNEPYITQGVWESYDIKPFKVAEV